MNWFLGAVAIIGPLTSFGIGYSITRSNNALKLAYAERHNAKGMEP